jgi:hypothetical protein
METSRSLPGRRRVVALRRPTVRRGWRSISGLAPLSCQRREVLLARLQGCCIGPCRTLRVHRKPYRPNDNANDASGDVLCGLHARLVGELLGLLIVAFNFCPDHRAVGIGMMFTPMKDPFIREKFTKEQSHARQYAKDYFEQYPKDRYQTEVESWRELQSGNIEYTMKRLREPLK